jgi:hypothetical protein
VFGNQHKKFKCKKIFYTGENFPPPLNYCDWSFTFDYLDDVRNYRFPIYLLDDAYYELQREKVIEESMANRKFCNFVASNGNCQERNDFVSKLSKYKKVDCGGRWMNNIGYSVSNKKNSNLNINFQLPLRIVLIDINILVTLPKRLRIQ